MILVAGVASEPPVRLAIEAAADLGLPCHVLDERAADSWEVEVAVGRHGIRGRVATADGEMNLDTFEGVYLRLSGDLPPRVDTADDATEAERRRAALALLSHWSEKASLRVANRPAAMASNASKPFQAQLIRRCGFDTPPTLVSNDPEAIRAFVREHGRVVYKSTSGIRSVVRELTATRDADLPRVRYLPTQFQALLRGTNVRVHVVGEAVLACEIATDAIDYRYGSTTTLTPVRLPAPVEQRCQRLSRRLELPLCGIDLLRTHDDRWWCFEVNPSPAYSCFEEPTGLPVSRCLVRWLAKGRARA